MTTRRQFLQHAAASSIAALSGPAISLAAEFPPTRVITRGPSHHWFGYYDKLQFDPTSRFVLGMQVQFEHRTPTSEDVITIGMVDLQDNDRWIPLGNSRAWNWQQGCMLQWLPGSANKIIWNDRDSDRFVSRIMNVETRQTDTVDYPIYSLQPNGKQAVTPDFRRIADVRPGYGYAGLADPFSDQLVSDRTGIFRVDLESGRADLILTLANIARLGSIPNDELGIKHYFNHLLFNPDGSRFIALHRWQYRNGSRLTRLITAAADGSDVRLVIPNGYASHFIWRDPRHVLSQSKNWLGYQDWGNFLFEDKDGGGKIEAVGRGVLDGAGHLSYLPGNKWILNDTYPRGAERLQTPHLYHIATGKRVDLGDFHLPAVYKGEWRVDTHPRYCPNSRYVCIDAPVAGQGRQLHLIDIREIVT
jgi:hypothetical protein